MRFVFLADVRNEKKKALLAYGCNLFRCTTGLKPSVTQL